ncbi:hypothetical protein LZZ50_02430 [Xanthomonas arboricola]|uniref:hypothetical protein n=1 Tax=Xanthomonas arboricola TaxID=56448 RepID=UPI001FD6339F|nr:hypothetical protein [Xanthomonas arboricola]UOS99255.1 hypothetical protein LZZ50_02430 [Xanthomonas arboricola]
MLKNVKFPLLYVVELLIWLPLLISFYVTSTFLAAKPIATLDLQGKSLPTGWEAAVPSHGKFLQGYLISNHPAAFGCSAVIMVGLAFLLYRVNRAQTVQRAEAGSRSNRSHLIANGLVFATLALIAYVLLTRVLVGVSAV